GGETCGDRNVGVDVGARHASLQARRLRAARNHAERDGAVVDAPRRLGRRPVAVHESLVAIYGGREERKNFGEQLELPGEVALEEPAHAVLGALLMEEVALAVRAPQALVRVAAAAGELRVPLGHEARHDPEPRRDLLRGRLEE